MPRPKPRIPRVPKEVLTLSRALPKSRAIGSMEHASVPQTPSRPRPQIGKPPRSAPVKAGRND